jgi:hypothetical protein
MVADGMLCRGMDGPRVPVRAAFIGCFFVIVRWF